MAVTKAKGGLAAERFVLLKISETLSMCRSDRMTDVPAPGSNVVFSD